MLYYSCTTYHYVPPVVSTYLRFYRELLFGVTPPLAHPTEDPKRKKRLSTGLMVMM